MSADQGPPTPPEPKTPMWLPALGAVLFLLVGGWWALRPNDEPVIQDVSTTAGTQAARKTDGGAPQLILQPPPSASIKPAMIPR